MLFADVDGYTAEAEFGESRLGLGVPLEHRGGQMSALVLGWKLQASPAQALFSGPNVMLMDEPTNHLNMESIESLNLALENYPGPLIFVSHDREFVSSLATRIIEMTPDGGIIDFGGNYEDYLRSQGVHENIRSCT